MKFHPSPSVNLDEIPAESPLASTIRTLFNDAVAGQTQYLVDGEPMVFSHVNNPYWPTCIFFIRSNQERHSFIVNQSLTPQQLTRRIQRIRHGADHNERSDLFPGKPPGPKPTVEILFEYSPEEIRQFHELYQRIPGLAEPLTEEEFAAILNHSPTDNDRALCARLFHNNTLWDETISHSAHAPRWRMRYAQALAQLPARYAGNTRAIGTMALNIDSILTETEQVRENVNFYGNYRPTIEHLMTLRARSGQILHPETGRLAAIANIDLGPTSWLHLENPVTHRRSFIVLRNYLDYLIAVEPFIRTYRELVQSGKIPPGINLESFLSVLQEIERLHGGSEIHQQQELFSQAIASVTGEWRGIDALVLALTQAWEARQNANVGGDNNPALIAALNHMSPANLPPTSPAPAGPRGFRLKKI